MEIVSNVKVYDLQESLIASGYPMRIQILSNKIEEKDLTRGHKLSKLTLDTNNQAHD